MIYKKPSNITYLGMCNYIDDVCSKKEVSQEEWTTIYVYLYLVLHMQARKYNFFATAEDYDNFSIITATKFYFRYESLFKKGKTIDKILGYIKDTIYFYKVQYQNEFFYQYANSKDVIEEDNLDSVFFERFFYDPDKEFKRIEVGVYIDEIPKTIRAFLNERIKIEDKKTFENIYNSCLLTMLYQLNIPNQYKKEYRGKELPEKVLTDIYLKSQNEVIVFHLPKILTDYVLILTKEIKKNLARDITDITKTYLSQSENSKNLILEDFEFTEETYEY